MCRILVIYGSFAKETYNLIDPSNCSHPLLSSCLSRSLSVLHSVLHSISISKKRQSISTMPFRCLSVCLSFFTSAYESLCVAVCVALCVAVCVALKIYVYIHRCREKRQSISMMPLRCLGVSLCCTLCCMLCCTRCCNLSLCLHP